MKYRSKPSEIEAVRWTGDNEDEVFAFVEHYTVSGSFIPTAQATGSPGYRRMELRAGKDGAQGWVPVPRGHYIVRQPGDLSDHWPVDPDYFAAKYEPLAPTPEQEPR